MNSFNNVLQKVINLSPIHLLMIVKSRIQRIAYKYYELIIRREIIRNQILNSLGNQFETLELYTEHLRVRQKPKFFIPIPSNQLKNKLRNLYPQIMHLTLDAADNIVNHKFDLLGSGLSDLGENIDWHSDFKTGYRWFPHLYFGDIKWARYPGGFDIKIPWELSRFQYAVWLGQAYWFTGNEKYSSEFTSLAMDWINKNPYPYGVNWSSTMDVSIRVVNWLWGFYFFKNSKNLSEDFLRNFIKSLAMHGRYIVSNLEIYQTPRGRFTNNHYISNLIALIYLGFFFPELKEATKWLDLGISELEKEMFQQVFEDGSDYESSTYYHCFVTEMFISAVLISRLNGYDFSDAFMNKLEKMLELILYMTKPDGTIPIIGDNDNGRILRLRVWKDTDSECIDYRYLLSIGAILFGRKDFSIGAKDQWQESFWFFGESAIKEVKTIKDSVGQDLIIGSNSFPNGGIYIIRYRDNYVAIDAGQNGPMGYGGHAHNDIFSFEFFSEGRTWIVDPGTYVYTSDYESRQLFRTTAYHNTVVLEGHEQNVIYAENPFRMEADAKVNVIKWEDNDEYIFFCGEHYGYRRLPENVIHRRYFYFDKDTEVLLIHDLLHGSSNAIKVTANSHLHLSPNLVPSRKTGKESDFHIFGNDQTVLNIRILEPQNLEIIIKDTFVSPSYGVKAKTKTIAWSWRKQNCFAIALYKLSNQQFLDSRISDTSNKVNHLI